VIRFLASPIWPRSLVQAWPVPSSRLGRSLDRLHPRLGRRPSCHLWLAPLRRSLMPTMQTPYRTWVSNQILESSSKALLERRSVISFQPSVLTTGPPYSEEETVSLPIADREIISTLEYHTEHGAQQIGHGHGHQRRRRRLPQQGRSDPSRSTRLLDGPRGK
jgi:hypothetical protein